MMPELKFITGIYDRKKSNVSFCMTWAFCQDKALIRSSHQKGLRRICWEHLQPRRESVAICPQVGQLTGHSCPDQMGAEKALRLSCDQCL